MSSPPSTRGGRFRRNVLMLASDLRFIPAPNPTDGGLLHRRSTALVARIGSIEWEVLRRFDGTSNDHVRERLERECGVQIMPDDLEAFARRAQAIGLLATDCAPLTSRRRWRGLTCTVPIWNPERLFEWCAPRASCVCHPVAIACGVSIVAIAAVTVWHGAPSVTAIPIGIRISLFLLLLNIVSIAHECAHGIALHRCGGAVREIGVRFVLGWPCWYCDITESYLLPRLRDRIAVILAGPFTQAVLCGAIILAARSTHSYVLAVRNDVTLLGVLTALNFFPLVRSDGYYLLTELLAIPNLRSDAWKWLTSSETRRRMRSDLPLPRRLAIVVYAFASSSFVALVLARAAMLIERVLAGDAQVSIRTVAVSLSALVMVGTVVRRRGLTP